MKIATALTTVAIVTVTGGGARAEPPRQAPVVVDLPGGVDMRIGDVVSQVERALGRPSGPPTTAIAADAGGRALTTAEVVEVLVGKPAVGVTVLGVARDGQLSDATIGDVADGVVDGRAARPAWAFGGVSFIAGSWDSFGLTCWVVGGTGHVTCALVETFPRPTTEP